MKSNFSSALSLVAGLAFAIVLTFCFSLLIGCDSADKESTADKSTASVQTSAPATAAVPSSSVAPAAVPVTPTEPIVETPAVVTYEDAESAYRERDYGHSAALFAQYTEQHPDNPWGHYMLGLSSWKNGSYEAAETAFLDALELDADHVKSLLNLSRVYLDTDRAEEALVRIDAAMLIDPSFGVTHRLRGRALHEVGRLAESEDAYREAIRIDNRDAWAMNNLGLVLIDQEFFELAVAPLARATELRSDMALFFNNLGMALERTEHYRDAEAAYGKAVELDAAYAKAVANLTRIESVKEDPMLESIDLDTMARDFEAEIQSWSDEAVPREEPIAQAENAVLDEAIDESIDTVNEAGADEAGNAIDEAATEEETEEVVASADSTGHVQR